MDFWEQLLATALGAVVGGGVTLAGLRLSFWQERAGVRNDAKRAAIIDLQDALAEFGVAAGAAADADLKARESGGVSLPDSSDEMPAVYSARTRLRLVLTRVDDDGLRSSSERARDLWIGGTAAEDRPAARHIFEDADSFVQNVDERVRELLRTL